MGVPELWQIINEVGQKRSLTHIAVVDGFEKNSDSRRAFRVGIDASIWFHHALLGGKGGENPALRTLFFRLCSLSEYPILPLFIFDGNQRPDVKRGSKKGKAGSHGMTADFKVLLDAFNMEWRMALAEAEAELAELNRRGIIDAVLTDDVDALIFGAQMVIKNFSPSLSGNRANVGGELKNDQVWIYNARDLIKAPISLTRGGLILIALLKGGDYDCNGVEKIGIRGATGLARCGFGDQLLAAYQRRNDQNIAHFLAEWRAQVTSELNTNSRGFLSRRYASAVIPSDFPDLKVLAKYVDPLTSFSSGGHGGGQMRDRGTLSIPKIAGVCEKYFGEWGHRSGVIKRFRNLLWEAAVIQLLRQAALEGDRDRKEREIRTNHTGPHRLPAAAPTGTPASLVRKYLGDTDTRTRSISDVFVNPGCRMGGRADLDMMDTNPLIMKITRRRTADSTNNILEYRVQICPIQLVDLANSGMKGARPEPSTPHETKTPPPPPHSPLLMWIPSSMISQVHPQVVEDFEASEVVKKDKTSKRKDKAKALPHNDISLNLPAASSSGSEPKDVAPTIHNLGVYDPFPLAKGGFSYRFPNPDTDDDEADPSFNLPVALMGTTGVSIRSHQLQNSQNANKKRSMSEAFLFSGDDDPAMAARKPKRKSSTVIPLLQHSRRLEVIDLYDDVLDSLNSAPSFANSSQADEIIDLT